MTYPAISSAMPAEEALAAYERHQDAQPEVTDKMVEGVANFIDPRQPCSRPAK